MIKLSETTTFVSIPLPSDWQPTERQKIHMEGLKDVDEVCHDMGSYVQFTFKGFPTPKQVQAKINIINRLVEKQMKTNISKES